MQYIADLHIHSCFSRATSKASRLPGLAAWAAIKGIQVLGTGDFTHPGWLQHLSEQLVPAEPGFFKLATWSNDEIAALVPEGVRVDDLAIADIRFVLSSEVSSIYKKDDKVRKIHNLLYALDFETVRRINNTLAGIGNIESDGRPILGLDARNLLEILLENGPEGFLVPAHVWTPWFSLFGSRSGFDALEECFGDLSSEIFALETGLSSDPAMNRCISALDRYTLISNSDCHSPSKLGREANIFTTGFDFFSLQAALRSPVDQHGQQVFSATIEFYPEEGKYHCDGHRKCHVCLEPSETIDKDGLCPVCGKPVTVGVLHRVMDLADRQSPVYPKGSPTVHSLIPLPEILSELLNVGPASKKVMRTYGRLINTFSSEFNLLLNVPIPEIADFGSPFLAEAIQRVRNEKVIRQPGYDGEFGVIRVFEEQELSRLAGQLNLFGETARPVKKKKAATDSGKNRTASCAENETIQTHTTLPLSAHNMTDNHSDLTDKVNRLQETIEQLRQENSQLQEKARHADSANKAKSDFLAMISHEIRTPMNGVIGLSELLLGTGLEDRQKHFVELILASARNLLTLINSLLDFSKIEAQKMILDMDPFDLKAMLTEVMELFILSGQQKNILVSSHIDPQLYALYIGDGYRIRQILVNLLGNAMKFTEKGEVQLIVSVVQREHNRDLLRFEVKDTGPGIVPEKQGQLFQPFTQLDGPSSLRHSGTGLGLSICAKLIELMKGSVGLSSEPGRGSIFWFQISLPVKGTEGTSIKSSRERFPGQEVPSDVEEKPVDHLRILIVDDEPTNRMVLRETLQNAGAEVVEAADGREAVALCAQTTTFDLIFMDCQMPVMDGFESTVKIVTSAERAGKTPPPVVALTADATRDTRQRCRDSGMADYLLKPLDFDELQEVVGRFLPGLGGAIQGRHIIAMDVDTAFREKNIVVNPSAIDKLRQNIGNISPVITVFLQTLENRLQGIEAAVNAKNADNIARSAHTLKGSSSQFGAEELESLCRQLEKMGRENSIAGADTLLLEMQRAADRLREVLSKELD